MSTKYRIKGEDAAPIGESDDGGDGFAIRARRRRSFARRMPLKMWLAILALAVAVFLLRDRMFITVGSGEVLLVFYRFAQGTRHNHIAGEGLHIVAPWDRAFLYKTQTQNVISPMTVMAKNGVEVKLDAQIQFRAIPEMVPYLHRSDGPNYVEVAVKPQLNDAVQSVIGHYLPEELYASETREHIRDVLSNANKSIGGRYLVVEGISLVNIRVPDKVQSAIQDKLKAEQDALAHAYLVQREERESERKAIEAKALQQYATAVSGIPRSVLVWKGIEATRELAKSAKPKLVVIGNERELPMMLGRVSWAVKGSNLAGPQK